MSSENNPLPPTSRSSICAACGGAINVPYFDGLDYGRRPEFAAAVERLFALVICDACETKKMQEASAYRKRISETRAREESFAFGWMTSDAHNETFARSDRNIEMRDDDTSEAYLWGRTWRPEQPKNSAWISGPKGTGKSFLARCVLNRAITLGLHAREITAHQLQTFALDFREGKRKLRYVRTVGMLLIEEIAVPHWRDEGVIELREIIDYRARHKLGTLITSNNDPEDMRSAWNAACQRNVTTVASMLDRMRGFQRLTMLGDTLRGRIAETKEEALF